MKNLKVIIIAITCFLSLNLLSQNEVKSNRFVQYGYVGIGTGMATSAEGFQFEPSIYFGLKKGFCFSHLAKACPELVSGSMKAKTILCFPKKFRDKFSANVKS